MPGSAVIGSSVLDGLLAVVDDIRDMAHELCGTRQVRVYTVERTWVSGTIGDGAYADVATEITPRPLVLEGQRDVKEPGGRETEGLIEVSQVSLTYTEDELTGTPASGKQWFYRIDEGHGQSIASAWYVLQRPPYADRHNSVGWVLSLRRAADEA